MKSYRSVTKIGQTGRGGKPKDMRMSLQHHSFFLQVEALPNNYPDSGGRPP